jgi:hypothetical protein
MGTIEPGSTGNHAFCRRLILLQIRGETMTADDSKRAYRKEMLLATAMVVGGLAIVALSMADIKADNSRHMAQATQPLQGTPAPPDQDKAPAESKPGGARPTTPAPQPARPDPQAQKEGATPALPAAPAEKTGPPIKEK